MVSNLGQLELFEVDVSVVVEVSDFVELLVDVVVFVELEVSVDAVPPSDLVLDVLVPQEMKTNKDKIPGINLDIDTNAPSKTDLYSFRIVFFYLYNLFILYVKTIIFLTKICY